MELYFYKVLRADIGPGTGTGMTLIASRLMGIPVGKITFELGDSSLPPAPSQGGSATLFYGGFCC